MTTETAYLVGVPATPQVTALLADTRSAHDRATKADPGDRFDITRFEALLSQLEQHALAEPRTEWLTMPDGEDYSSALLIGGHESGCPPIVRASAMRIRAAGRVPVLVVDSLRSGPTAAPAVAVRATDPAERWDSGGARGRRAVELRFRSQLVAAAGGDGPRSVSPSGIQNSIVTEMLREFAAAVPGEPRRDVAVDYRDGSRAAHPFPLRALALTDTFGPADIELRFALLSIRHTEMDAFVHGAWLRNAEISRPRPAAQTDDLVYDLSRRQLAELCRDGALVRLHLYQTGLEMAVVGFYKALVHHLLVSPGSVSVQPMYYEALAPPAPPDRPRRRSTGRSRPARPAPRVVDSATFRKGTPWTM